MIQRLDKAICIRQSRTHLAVFCRAVGGGNLNQEPAIGPLSLLSSRCRCARIDYALLLIADVAAMMAEEKNGSRTRNIVMHKKSSSCGPRPGRVRTRGRGASSVQTSTAGGATRKTAPTLSYYSMSTPSINTGQFDTRRRPGEDLAGLVGGSRLISMSWYMQLLGFAARPSTFSSSVSSSYSPCQVFSNVFIYDTEQQVRGSCRHRETFCRPAPP